MAGGHALAQSNTYVDSLANAVLTMSADTSKVLALGDLCWLNRFRDTHQALQYGREGIALAQALGFERGQANIWNKMGVVYRHMENFVEALKCYDQAYKVAERTGNLLEMAHAYNNMGHAYSWQGHYQMQLDYSQKALALFEQLGNEKGVGFALTGAIIASLELQHYPEALSYAERSYVLRAAHGPNIETMVALLYLGRVHTKMGQFAAAKDYLMQGVAMYEQYQFANSALVFETLAETYVAEGRLDSALYYAQRGLGHSESQGVLRDIMRTSKLVADVYEQQHQLASAYAYLKQAYAYRDSVQQEDNAREIANHGLRQKQQELEDLERDSRRKAEELAYERARIRWATIGFAVIVLAVTTIMLVINSHRRKLKRANDQLARANAEIGWQKETLAKQADELQLSNNSKDKLFSIIGHDLRSPVNTLRAMMEMVANQSITFEEFNQFSPQLQRSVVAVSETLDNLLHWSQSQLNGIQTHPTDFAICRIVQANEQLFGEVAASKSIRLTSLCHAHLRVHADENQVNLVLRNLVNNAIKFTPMGGQVHIAVQEYHDQFVEIAVTDTGVGMSADKLKKLFKVSSHFSQYGTDGEKGTGLGLLLCQEMVERNGGTLHVSSQPGQGSTFAFTLKKSRKNQTAS